MPLCSDVDLYKLAEITHGFVGADLAALAKEAGMVALRRILSETRSQGKDITKLDGIEAQVRNTDFSTAFREIEPTALREFLPERPGIKLKDVGGLQKTKSELTSLIEISLQLSKNNRDIEKGMLPRGLFFVGPPGTGKTLLARALSGEFEIPLIAIYSSLLFSRWVGESEKQMEEVFSKAKHVAPCILLLDEVDSIAPERRKTEDSGVTQRIVSQLLREIDKAKDLRDLIVIATTNRPDLVDPSLIQSGRFDYIVRFDPPDREERLEIFQIHAEDLGLPDLDFDWLASASDGFVGSDIDNVCKRVRMAGILRNLASSGEAGPRREGLGVDMEDFQRAIHEVRAQTGSLEKKKSKQKNITR
jgi:transitional endoplasmic reticulum ATPase